MAFGATNPFRTIGQQSFAKPIRTKSAIPTYRTGGLAQAAPDFYPVGGSSTAPQFAPLGSPAVAPTTTAPFDDTAVMAAAKQSRDTYPIDGRQTTVTKTSTAPSTYDYSADPILAQIRSSQQGYVSSQAAAADAARKRLLTDYGSADLARQTIFGAPGVQLQDAGGNTTWSVPDTQMTGDEATALAAQQNPLSTLAQLLQGHQQRDLGITENLNKGNLLFSSSFGHQHGLEGQRYAGEQATQAAAARDALAAITQQLLGAEQTGIGGVQQGEADAFNRAINIALANALAGNTTPAGGGDTTTAPPPVTPPPSAPDSTGGARGAYPQVLPIPGLGGPPSAPKKKAAPKGGYNLNLRI